MDKKAKDILFKQTKTSYGSEYKAHCLEMYRIFVEQMAKIRSMRESANRLFLSLNTAIIGLVGYILTGESEPIDSTIIVVISIAGITLNFFWRNLLLSYKNLTSIKFKIIQEIEHKLPLALYNTEWELLSRKGPYKPFTKKEILVINVFIGLYVAIGFIFILSIICTIKHYNS